MSRIKIGVMGCAAIARKSVIPAIQALPDHFELVAIASRTMEKATEFAAQFNCKAIEGYDKLLLEDIQAVYLPLPTGLLDTWISRSLTAGKHVYGEKSIAGSLQSAQRMVNLAEENRVALMEGYMFQYHPQHQKVKELIAAGEIGEVRHYRGAFGFPPLGQDNFRYDNEVGGGAINDAAGYPLRALHFLLGEDFKVAASTMHRHPETGTVIYGGAFLKNKTGVGADIAFGFDNFYQCNYEIWGSKGKLTAERAYTPGPDYSPGIILEKQGSRERIEVKPYNHFVGAMTEFHSIIVDEAGRGRHFQDILLQSESLEFIRELF